MKTGVYPGTFDPLTIAHLAVADAARHQLDLDRVELALSRDALGRPEAARASIEERVRAIERAADRRPWLGVVVVDRVLIADIAQGYAAVLMGADKWVQVNDPRWYDDEAARDAALASMPRIVVAPRSGIQVPSALRLEVPDHIAEVSATEVRAGRHEWAADTSAGPPDLTAG